jgi:ABC-type Mn2+/Zn2+ transport system permease subunit
LWTDRLGPTFALSAAFAVTAGVVGLAISQHVRVAAGGTIVLVATGLFVLSLLASPRHGLIAAARRRTALS